MHGRSLKLAVRHLLTAFWSLEGGTEVRVTYPPGRPVGVTASWACMIHDAPLSYGREGKIGQYTRFGAVLTVSQRVEGLPLYDLEAFLDERRDGFDEARDALIALLHARQWTVLDYANRLADAVPGVGPNNNLVEAAKPLSCSATVARGPDWWGEVPGAPAGARRPAPAESMVRGLSCDILFGGALAITPAGFT